MKYGLGAPARMLLIVLAVFAGGCASVVLDPTAPPGFDLNGTWVLDPVASDPNPDARRLRTRGFVMATATQDFAVLTCRRMHIEQNRDSMGVEYDGVNYRDVSWGERTRGLWEVNAGWDEGQLWILSKARDAVAEETMVLVHDGQRLVVRVTVEADGGSLTVTKQFTRER